MPRFEPGPFSFDAGTSLPSENQNPLPRLSFLGRSGQLDPTWSRLPTESEVAAVLQRDNTRNEKWPPFNRVATFGALN